MYVFVAEIAELLLKGLSTLIKLPFQTFWIIEVLCIFFFSAFHLSQNNDTGKVATEYTHITVITITRRIPSACLLHPAHTNISQDGLSSLCRLTQKSQLTAH